MLRVAGILSQQITGNVRALSTVDKALFLAAGSDGTFAVEGMTIGFNTATAMAGFFVGTAGTVQAAAGINHGNFIRFYSILPRKT
jgi:hypothetical protein